jgi:hypothetical protein
MEVGDMGFMNIRQRSAFVVIGLFISLILGSGVTFAQITTGEILGTVKDPSGAVIPGAKVTLHNDQTGLTLSTTTNGSGLYYFTPIVIGRYDVTVSKTGFRTVTHSNITVELQASVVVNFTSMPGKVTTLIQVSAAPPQLQTTNATTGGIVTTNLVSNLPLETRNYTFLAQLMPGVTSLAVTGGGRVGFTGGYQANGMNSEWNSYMLDGIDNNNEQTAFQSGAAYVTLPPPDALAEFQVATSTFSAQYGRAAGGVIMAQIKSGTNQYHGDVWEYNQNNAYDANGFFENASHTAIPKLAYNQFGFTFGGPVVIPHVYNGHDHLFFFGDYQGTREATADFEEDTVPTKTEIASGFTDFQDTYPETTEDYTDILGRTFPGAAIMDPATARYLTAGETDPVTGLTAKQTGYARDPFYLGSLAGITNFTGAAQEAMMNQLPANRLDPNATKILGLFPAPNTPGILGGTEDNFATNYAEPYSENHYDIRVDEDFGPKNQMNAAVSYDSVHELAPASINSGYGDNGTAADNTFALSSELSYTHIFSPTFINELLLGYNRDDTSTNAEVGADTVEGIPEMFGIQGVTPETDLNEGLPGIHIAGLTDLGQGAYTTVIMDSNTTDLQDNVTKVYGKHTFKGGFEAQFLYYPWYNPYEAQGVMGFGEYAGIWDQTGSYTGQGMADILLKQEPATVPGGLNYDGGPDSVSDSYSAVEDSTRSYYAPWFQDTFKATPKLTLTAGLRWEYEGQVNERYGRESNFTPGTYCGLNKFCGAVYYISDDEKNVPLSPSFTQLMAQDNIAIEYKSMPILNTPLGNWAPHLGVAWEVTPKLVARAGYGIFYGGFITNGSNNPSENYPDYVQRSNPPTATSASPIVYGNGAVATLEQGFGDLEPTSNAAGFSASGIGLDGFSYPWKDTASQDWNVALQYQLTPNQTITLGYMGTHVTHIYSWSSWDDDPTEIVPPGTDTTNGCAVTDSIDDSCNPFPDIGVGWNGDNGDQHYEGGYVEFQRRFSQGLQTLMDYTYSKCMGNDYPALGDGNYASGGVRYPEITGSGGLTMDNAVCDGDAPNVFHGAVTWTVPFGRGQRFGPNMSKALNLIAGGWKANAIVTMQNGYPYTIGCSGPATNGNPGNCNALEVPGQNIYAGQSLPGHFLNINAFQSPPVDTTFNDSDFAALGGANGQIHGPTYEDVDFSMFKNFQISESKSLQFRAEFFNFFNTPQWETGAFYNTNYLSPPEFGAISATIPNVLTGESTGRMIQFALKFFF